MNVLALDVGEKRIGVAQGDDSTKIAFPYDTIEVDGHEIEAILALIETNQVQDLIIGYPRNQSGETTAQTQFVEDFVAKLEEIPIDTRITYQDESLTSVIATQRLEKLGKPYQKGDIDAMAACIILEDYFQEQR